MSDELIFEQKEFKGEDGYRVISIRISESLLKQVDSLSNETDQSRNALINTFIKYGLDHSKVIKKK